MTGTSDEIAHGSTAAGVAEPRATTGRDSKLLVSACLLGRPVRYDGSAKAIAHPLLERLRAEGRLVVACPEMSAGFGVPRPPAEIARALDGTAVLAGEVRVVEATGGDVTEAFLAGARAALNLARGAGCRFALLVDGSPSCASSFVYGGSFSGRKRAGAGTTAALLRQHGIEVFSESEIDSLALRL